MNERKLLSLIGELRIRIDDLEWKVGMLEDKKEDKK